MPGRVGPGRGAGKGDSDGWLYILNVCVNAIHAGSTYADPAMWMVTWEMMEREMTKVRNAKVERLGGNDKTRRRIGFQRV